MSPPHSSPPRTEPPSRLLSLDALRGFTIAAMIVVNTPGSWAAIYPPLRHAEWHGLTPTDLIFPCFLFIVGVSIALAYAKRMTTGADLAPLRRKVLVRSAKILAVGLLLNLWPEFAWSDLRVAGVLPRIAIVFGVVALLFLWLRWQTLVVLLIALLVGYWGLLTWVPVPRDAVIEQALATGHVERAWGEQTAVTIAPRSAATIAPNLEPGTNLAAWVDRHALPGRRYESTWDPEGLLSTLPALATALLGVLAGLAVLHIPATSFRIVLLGGGGALLLAAGYAVGTVFPLNKNLWTSSYVLVAGGWTMLGWGALLGLVDGLGLKRLALPGLVFGANAITAYVLAGMLLTVTHRGWGGSPSWCDMAMAGLQGASLSAAAASLLCALAYTAIVFVPIAVLYRRRIFIRL